jgi:hypothetical protein
MGHDRTLCRHQVRGVKTPLKPLNLEHPMKTILIAVALAFAVIGGAVALTGPTSTPAHAACPNPNC